MVDKELTMTSDEVLDYIKNNFEEFDTIEVDFEEYKEDIIELHHYPKDESKESVYIEVI